jgi:hypothetical protein
MHSTAVSQQRPKRSRKSNKNPIFASKLFAQSGKTTVLERLVSDRIGYGLCTECGGVREGSSDFCRECLSRFPVIFTDPDIYDYDAWSYSVLQIKPAYEASAFKAQRVPVLERRGRSQTIGYADTLADAWRMARKLWERAQAGGQW